MSVVGVIVEQRLLWSAKIVAASVGMRSVIKSTKKRFYIRGVPIKAKLKHGHHAKPAGVAQSAGV
jgi:hypothetical protein